MIFSVLDGLNAQEAYELSDAGFIMTEQQMHNMNGAALFRQLCPPTMLPILMESLYRVHQAEASDAGASWFLYKEEIGERVPKLMRNRAWAA